MARYELSTGLILEAPEIQCLTTDDHRPYYLVASGPARLIWEGATLAGQGFEQHPHGFSAPIGEPSGLPQSSWITAMGSDLEAAGLATGARLDWRYDTGVALSAQLVGVTRSDEGALLVLSLTDCQVLGPSGELLCDPAWGAFDLALMTHCRALG